MAPRDIGTRVSLLVPSLRRFARALVGDQAPGDEAVAATLRRIIDDPSFVHVDGDGDLRIDLFRQFYLQWAKDGSVVVTPPAESDPRFNAAQEALKTLTTIERTAYLLHGIEEMTIAEVSAVLDLPEHQAQSTVASGKNALMALPPMHVTIVED